MKTKFIFLLFFFTLFTIKGEALVTVTSHQLQLMFEHDDPGPRSLIGVPAKAFLQNSSFLYIEFTENTKEAIVSVVNINDNETVFSQTCTDSNNISVDLIGEDPGDYKLKMIIDGAVVVGYFSL